MQGNPMYIRKVRLGIILVLSGFSMKEFIHKPLETIKETKILRYLISMTAGLVFVWFLGCLCWLVTELLLNTGLVMLFCCPSQRKNTTQSLSKRYVPPETVEPGNRNEILGGWKQIVVWPDNVCAFQKHLSFFSD